MNHPHHPHHHHPHYHHQQQQQQCQQLNNLTEFVHRSLYILSINVIKMFGILTAYANSKIWSDRMGSTVPSSPPAPLPPPHTHTQILK